MKWSACKHGHWHATVGTRLFGRTLGIYAFGHIGAAVARVGQAFGMHVVCWGREGSTARARAEGFEIAASREAFFEQADVLSLHLPGNRETRGIITAADLARMQPTALLVNTSRAPIIAEGALVAALHKGTTWIRSGRRVRSGAGRRRAASVAADAECPVHAAPGVRRARQLRSPVHSGRRPVARLRRGDTHQRSESGGRWEAIAQAVLRPWRIQILQHVVELVPARNCARFCRTVLGPLISSPQTVVVIDAPKRQGRTLVRKATAERGEAWKYQRFLCDKSQYLSRGTGASRLEAAVALHLRSSHSAKCLMRNSGLNFPSVLQRGERFEAAHPSQTWHTMPPYHDPIRRGSLSML